MSLDFTPPDNDEHEPPFWIILAWVLGFLVAIPLLWLIGMTIWNLLMWVLAPVLTAPVGSCLYPVCALILIPRRLVRVVDVNGKTVTYAHPHHRIPILDVPLYGSGSRKITRYQIAASTWWIYRNQRAVPTFITQQFTDCNGQTVICADVINE